jgi:hypothetical protein
MFSAQRLFRSARRPTASLTCLALSAALLLSGAAQADHHGKSHGNALLPEQSSLQFISVKNAAIAEVHHFKQLSGGIEDGAVEVSVPLSSVETMIPIRNERMQKLLFETGMYPTATVSAQLDMAPVMALDCGEYMTMTLPLTVELHGATQTLDAALRVSRMGDEIHVMTDAPLVISAADFGLAEGVDKLRTVAALDSISTAVPVTAHFVFSR